MPGFNTILKQFSRHSTRYYPVLNLLLFKFTWILLVLGQDAMLLYALGLQCLSLVLHPRLGHYLGPTMLLTCCGCLLDFLLARAGIFSFPTPGLPVWLALLWFAFLLCVPSGLRFLYRLPLFWRIGLGMLLGPLSYWLGARFGAVEFPRSLPLTLGLLALLWGSLLPLAMQVLRRAPALPAGTALLCCLLTLGLPGQPLLAAPELVGQGRLSFLFMPIYEASLYSNSKAFSYPPEQPFTLAIQYFRSFKQQQLIAETYKQWSLQQREPKAGWSALLEQLPDVEAGDELALQVDARLHATLLQNGQAVGEFPDPDFVLAFTGIWLDPDTTRPQLRRELLGI